MNDGTEQKEDIFIKVCMIHILKGGKYLLMSMERIEN